MAEKAFLYEQIAQRLAGLIHDGSLQAGEKAPSLRQLSRNWDVSLTSVMKAYALLEDQGLLEAQPRSGFVVRSSIAPEVPEPEFQPVRSGAFLVRKSQLISSFLEMLQDPANLYFGCATPHPSLLPSRKIARALTSAMRNQPLEALNYIFPPGLEELRRQIAVRALESQCQISPRDIVITSGALDALNLSLRAVAQPGDGVIIESPTYFGVLQSLESLGLKAIPVNTHPRDGMDPEAFEQALERQNVRAALVVSNFNNPLGSVIPSDKKRQLVELATRHQVPIIEDDVYGELYLGAKRPRTLKSYDREGWVLLCSGFSKSLSPGLRVGWVASERFREPIKQLQFMTTLCVATPSQMAVADFLQSGRYSRHLKKFRKVLRQSLSHFQDTISAHFPKGTRMTCPQGGFVLWLELPGKLDSLELFQETLKHKLSFVPGPLFSPHDEFKNWIRITFAHPWREEVQEKLLLLGKLIQGALEKSH